MIPFESKLTVRGELHKDAEYRLLEDGGHVCKLTVPMPVTSREADEEYHKPYLLQISVFGKLAQECARLKKGNGIAFEGRLHATRYKGKKGDHRASLGAIAKIAGYFYEITDQIKWLETAADAEAAPVAAKVKKVDEPAHDAGVEAFLHGQAASAVPGEAIAPGVAGGSLVPGPGVAAEA